MPTLDTCRAEIERLHDCFVDWFGGTVPEEEFGPIDRALAEEFEMVTPEGDRVPRDLVLDSIRGEYDGHEPGTFDIEIRNVELVAATDGHATVRYEEWQDWGGETDARVSTVLFRADPDAPGGLRWVDLHETRLE